MSNKMPGCHLANAWRSRSKHILQWWYRNEVSVQSINQSSWSKWLESSWVTGKVDSSLDSGQTSLSCTCYLTMKWIIHWVFTQNIPAVMLLPIDTFVFWISKTVVSVAIGGALVERIIVVFDVDDLAWYSKVVGACWDVHGEGLLTVVSAPVTDPFSTWPCVVKMSRPVTDPICNWLWVVSMTSDPDEVDVDGRKSPVMKRKVKSIIWYPASIRLSIRVSDLIEGRFLCDFTPQWFK